MVQQKISILQGCNPVQRQAILHDHDRGGPLLLLAGAGSGKTAVLTKRIQWGVAQGIDPGKILALTFTRKAAEEMRHRVAEYVGEKARNIRLCTFHAFAWITIQECFEGTPNWRRLGFSSLPLLGNHKQKGLPLDQLVPKAMQLLRDCPQYRQHLQANLQWILIDEYQDIDPTQYEWVRLLLGTKSELFVVGDDDQAIYSFRGADVGNILRFQRDFPQCTLLKLEWNYRSTPTILNHANDLFPHKSWALRKRLRPGSRRKDPLFFENAPVSSFWGSHPWEELNWLVAECARLHNVYHLAWDKIAVLCRFNRQVSWYRLALEEQGLPCQLPEQTGIQVLTIHSSKGLQYPIVFVVGLEDGILPAHPQQGNRAFKSKMLEEEERLFYVAVTRAECRLYLLGCRERIWRGKRVKFAPSRFLPSPQVAIDETRRIAIMPSTVSKLLILLRSILYMGFALPRFVWAQVRHGKNLQTWVEATLLKWAAYETQIMHLNLEVHGQEVLDSVDWTRPVFVVANHQSYLDIPVVLLSFQRMLGFVAKKELDRIPLLGYWMRQIGSLVIDRSKKGIGHEVKDRLASTGRPPHIVIFPEGTRSRNGQLQNFKSGAFRYAKEFDGWLIPLVIQGSREGWENRNRDWSERQARSYILEPIDCAKLSDVSVKQLQAQVQETMKQALLDLSNPD